MVGELKLFRTWSSVFGLRPALALKIKGVEYETKLEDLSNKSAALLEYNPVHKKIPVLVHNGKPICESLVILEYIDDTWKTPQLMPQDPYDKATARFWAKFGDDKICEEICDLKIVDAEAFPLISTWIPNFANHPAIKECWPPRDKMVEKFSAIRQMYLSKAL